MCDGEQPLVAEVAKRGGKRRRLLTFPATSTVTFRGYGCASGSCRIVRAGVRVCRALGAHAIVRMRENEVCRGAGEQPPRTHVDRLPLA